MTPKFHEIWKDIVKYRWLDQTDNELHITFSPSFYTLLRQQTDFREYINFGATTIFDITFSIVDCDKNDFILWTRAV